MMDTISRGNLSTLFQVSPQVSPLPTAVPQSRSPFITFWYELDIAQLGLTVQELFVAGLADSTRKAYKSGERRYTEFCTRTGVTPFPTKETTLSAFVAPPVQGGFGGQHGEVLHGSSATRQDRLGPWGS